MPIRGNPEAVNDVRQALDLYLGGAEVDHGLHGHFNIAGAPNGNAVELDWILAR